ncbi:MAG: PrpR N-terminal domain-containing protein, partial [Bacillota bacterium]|nr:PrpR N-terminal domain-containing protein [Bacillota bacterium]
MNSKQLWLVAPHSKLAEEAQNVCQELNINLEIRIGNMYPGVEIAKQAVQLGAEVIISRGGTAELIRQAVEVPVVEIRSTGFDLLKALYPVKDYQETIAVIGFKNVIYGATDMGEILNLNIREITLNNKYEIPEKIKQVMTQGIKLIIGDTDVVKEASDAGIETRLIYSGKESVAKAIEEAQRINKIRQAEQAKAKELKTIVDNVREGIISINHESIVSMFNAAAEIILKEQSYNMLGKKIDSLIPELDINEGSALTKVMKIKDKDVIINTFPVIVEEVSVGAIITLQEVNKLRKLEQQVRWEISNKGLIATKTFADIVGQSAIIKETISEAERYSKVDSTILIIGESGTGKEIFAQGIHNASFRS